MDDQEFLDRWHYWKFALGSENPERDPNTLIEQMSSMVWGIGIFKSTMYSWGKEPYPGSEELKVTPILFHFVFDNFFKSLCLSLRRITDNGCLSDGEGKTDRSVISIPSFLDDIKAHREDYTRERFFIAVGREYYIEGLREKYEEYISQFRSGQVYSVPQDLIVSFSEAEHSRWDALARISQQKRSESDLISNDYIDTLLAEASEIKQRIKFLTDKYYAHASTPESRASSSGREENLSLAQLITLTIRCGRLVNSISNMLSDAIWPFLPVAQFEKWENWGVGWKATREELENVWHEWQMEVERLNPIFMSNSVIVSS